MCSCRLPYFRPYASRYGNVFTRAKTVWHEGQRQLQATSFQARRQASLPVSLFTQNTQNVWLTFAFLQARSLRLRDRDLRSRMGSRSCPSPCPILGRGPSSQRWLPCRALANPQGVSGSSSVRAWVWQI